MTEVFRQRSGYLYIFQTKKLIYVNNVFQRLSCSLASRTELVSAKNLYVFNYFSWWLTLVNPKSLERNKVTLPRWHCSHSSEEHQIFLEPVLCLFSLSSGRKFSQVRGICTCLLLSFAILLLKEINYSYLLRHQFRITELHTLKIPIFKTKFTGTFPLFQYMVLYCHVVAEQIRAVKWTEIIFKEIFGPGWTELQKTWCMTTQNEQTQNIF